MVVSVTRRDVLGFRVRAQQLDRESGTPADTAVLDVGVQDTGPDGARWALALRGCRVSDPGELAMAWTVRGAPHLYRRADLPGVAAAVAPFSEADAAKRIFDAARQLKAAGIDTLTALDTVADAMRAVVVEPMVKGEVSRQVTALMDEPYLRFCRSCDAVHLYEQPFRLAALRAGLELEPGTSPPVLVPVPGLAPAAEVPVHLDVVRGYLRMFGPAIPAQVAAYLDAPLREVKARRPADAVDVDVDGELRWLLGADVDALGADPPEVTRLLGPYDLFLQARDRPLLVLDDARRKELWPVLGRPGAVLQNGEIVGTWRPRSGAGKLAVTVRLWAAADRTAIEEQAERLAAHRGVRLGSATIGA